MTDKKLIKAEYYFSREFGDTFYKENERPILIGIHISDPANMGGLIRLAGNIGCRKLVLVGDPNAAKHSKIRRAATTAFKVVDWKFVDDSSWTKEIPEDYTSIAVETCSGASNLFETKLPKKSALIVGNERFGLDHTNLNRCDQAVYIPMPGHTLSMNVTQAANIALFEWFRQQL